MKNKALRILFLSLALSIFLVPTISYAQVPADTIGGPTAIIRKVTDFIEKTKDTMLMKVGSKILNTAVSKALNKIAYDTATWIGSGGEGQKPLFVTKGFGAYMKDIGDNAIGDAIETFAAGTGYNFCSPDLNLKLKIGLGLPGLTEQVRPSDSACKLSDAINNWKNDINAKWAAFQSPDLLVNISKSFDVKAPGGVTGAFSVLSGAKDDLTVKTNNAETQQVRDKGYIDITDIGGKKTAAPDNAATTLNNAQAAQNAQITSKSGNSPLIDAANVFLNQLAVTAYNRALQKLAEGRPEEVIPGLSVGKEDWFREQVMKVTTCDRTPLDTCRADKGDVDGSKCYEGYSCDPSSCKCVKDDAATASANGGCSLSDPDCTANTSGVRVITQKLLKLAQPKFNVKADLDILSQLNSCPDASSFGVGPTDCVLDDKFMQAVQEKKTVIDAMSEGTLDGSWLMTADDKASFEEAYTLRSTQILRKYRILPLGWERAIEVANQSNPVISLTLMDAISCFDPNDSYNQFSTNFDPSKCAASGSFPGFVGLVDPSWVLKAPQTQCVKLGVGGQILSKDIVEVPTGDEANPTETQVLLTRSENYCADEQSCIKEKKDGSCEAYGYCTEEKRIWNFDSESCDPIFNTCRTFTSPTGRQASYLENTLDYSDCNQSQAGCRAYASTGAYNSLTDTINWSTAKLDYFNKTVATCDRGNEGCSSFVRTGNYHNYLLNSDFEDNLSVGAWTDPSSSTEPFMPGYASAKAMATTKTLVKNVVVGPSDYAIADEAYTLSFYAYCAATTTATLGEKTIDLPASNDWNYYYLSNVYSHLNTSNQVSFIIGAGCVVDKIKLEKGLDSSAYSKYGENDTIYEKILPQYLEAICYVGTGSSKNYDLKNNAPAICKNYAKKCNAEDVNCESYKAVGDNLSIPAAAKAADYCTAQCIGYDTYVQRETAFNTSTSFNFIPRTAKTCTAAAVGCNEFTNLDEVGQGGEGKEYYTYLRQCIKPDTTCKDFYSWENSGGQAQLKTYNLVGNGSAPKVSDATAYSFSGNNGNTACDEAIFKLSPSDPNYNADCRQFYNKAGEIAYANLGQTISCSASCLPYRVSDNIPANKCAGIGGTISNNACVVYAVPGEGRSCSAAENGCREYNGNQGNNVRIVKSYDFENNVNPVGDCKVNLSSVESESNIRDGHSLLIKNSGCANSTWQTTAALPFADKVVAFFRGVLNKLSLEALAGSSMPDKGVAINVGNSVVQNAAYTVKFLAKASNNSTINLAFANGTISAEFLSVEQANSITVPGDNTWRLYQMYLPSLDHSVASNESLIVTIGNQNVYLDNLILTQITDRFYLIKNSWQTPDSCYYDIFNNYQGVNYNLGCSAYTDRDNNTHYLRQFSKVCGESAVGCEAIVDTHNSANSTSTPDYIYAVYDHSKLCGADNKGCSRFGQALLSNQDVSIQNVYSDAYIKNDPDKPNISCEAKNVGCDEYKNSDGSSSFFRDPGGNTCEWRAGVNGGTNKWYRSAVMRCDMNNNAKIDASNGVVAETYNRLCLRDSDCAIGGQSGKCIVDRNDYLCPVEYSKTLGFGGPAIYQPAGATGICDAAADSCTELIDPESSFVPNLVVDPNGWSGSVASDKWTGGKQTLILTPNKLYSFSVTGSGSAVTLNCSTPNIRRLNSGNTLEAAVSSISLTPATNSNVGISIYIPNNNEEINSFRCVLEYPDYLNKNKIISLKELIIDYQLSKNLDYQSCNGAPDTDSGCVVLNERKQSGVNLAKLSYSANKSYSYNNLYGSCGGINQAPCDGNSLVKATPDRTCAKWLACDDYQTDNNKMVCSHYSECSLSDNQTGLCSSFAQTVSASHEYNAGSDKNSTGFSLMGNYYFKNMKEVGTFIGRWDFEGDGKDTDSSSFAANKIVGLPSTLSKMISYPAHGKNFVFANSNSAAASQVLTIAKDKDYYINFLVNVDALSGYKFIAQFEECDANGGNCVGDKPLALSRNGVSIASDATGGVRLDGTGWQRLIGKFTPANNKIKIIFKTDNSSFSVYLDDINIDRVLNTGNNVFISKDCRMYPKTDSLTCDSSDKSVVADGLYGYCLKYDEQNPTVCLMWYPVGGEGTSLDDNSATTGFSGYPSSGERPKYCTMTDLTSIRGFVEHRQMKVLEQYGYCSPSSEADAPYCFYKTWSDGAIKGSNSIDMGSTDRMWATQVKNGRFTMHFSWLNVASLPATLDYDYFVLSYIDLNSKIWQALLQVPSKGNNFFYDTSPLCTNELGYNLYFKITRDGTTSRTPVGSAGCPTDNSAYGTELATTDWAETTEECHSFTYRISSGSGGDFKVTQTPDNANCGSDAHDCATSFQVCVDRRVSGWYDYDGSFMKNTNINITQANWYDLGDQDRNAADRQVLIGETGESDDPSAVNPDTEQPRFFNTSDWSVKKASEYPLTCVAYSDGALAGWVERLKDLTKVNSAGWDPAAGVYFNGNANPPFSAAEKTKANPGCDIKSDAGCGLPYACVSQKFKGIDNFYCRYLNASGGKTSLQTTPGNLFNGGLADGSNNRYNNILKNVFLTNNGSYPFTYDYTYSPSGGSISECSGSLARPNWCAIRPAVKNISLFNYKKVTAAATDKPGYYTLQFGIEVDPEQLPIKTLEITWDAEGHNTTKTIIDPRPAENPFKFSHYFENGPKAGYPIIKVIDNWGFYDTASR